MHTIIKFNNIFDTNILSRGYPTRLKIYRNSRGWGYDKHPLWCIMEFHGGGVFKVKHALCGCMDKFWNYTIIDIMCFLQGSWYLIFNHSSNFYFYFLFPLYYQTLPYPKTKENRKLPVLKNYPQHTHKHKNWSISLFIIQWMVLHLQHAFCLVSGINSKFVFKTTLSSSSILQCYLPVLLCKASFWFRFSFCWTLRITLHVLHVQFATYKHFSGKLNVFHYQQTITFT